LVTRSAAHDRIPRGQVDQAAGRRPRRSRPGRSRARPRHCTRSPLPCRTRSTAWCCSSKAMSPRLH